jgi:hypothetical protein
VIDTDPLGQPEFLTNPLPTLGELQRDRPLYWSKAWCVDANAYTAATAGARCIPRAPWLSSGHVSSHSPMS